MKNKKLKIVTFANLKSGGKSSIARLVAELIKTSILNFDTERNAEHYNAVSTINIKKNISIRRTAESLILSDAKTEQTIKSKNGFLICDLGGYFDNRLMSLGSDFYILPTFKDYESMRETLITAQYILSNNSNARIIFILNGAMIRNAKEKNSSILEWEKLLTANDLSMFSNYYMPYSTLFEKLVNEKRKESEITALNRTLLYSYANVRKVIYQICTEIGAINERD